MKVILVTGANRGIGFEICRQLDEKGCCVILCSRDLDRGLKAASSLSKNIVVKRLDVTDEESITLLFEFVKSKFGKLDVLVNNAGIGANVQEQTLLSKAKQNIKKHFQGTYKILTKIKPIMGQSSLLNKNIKAQNISLEVVKMIMETNFYGAWRMIDFFIPLLQKSECGKIINISSGMGALNNLTGLYPGYSLSKTSLNALTIMFSNELKPTGIKVNAVCPGWVRTDMGGNDAPLSVSEGADTAVWLTLNDDSPTGKFFQNRQIIDW
jgi:NAD(P)-dependent dehydrogenase (short-subunit alcohol dehydrogenase family)